MNRYSAPCFNGRVPGSDFVLQTMAKSSLVGLTKGLARELGPLGITATIVDPGPIDTDMNPAGGETADFQRSLTALGRCGEAEDIAAAVAYLAGPGGRYVTGTASPWTAGTPSDGEPSQSTCRPAGRERTGTRSCSQLTAMGVAAEARVLDMAGSAWWPGCRSARGHAIGGWIGYRFPVCSTGSMFSR
ncbi:SDR family oxidoreductase [Nonomuraea sp. NPDC049152]|uniref:SDR family NAD(P)-dependent oxidoreductase n=1 Tax=Nonomuraea sp. NPDC049152 TaxID=3154350 RepID=UPI0033FB42F3